MHGTDTESSPSRTGLVTKITRPRRKKRRAPPDSSQNSTTGDDAGNEKHGRLRASIDTAVDRIKSKTSTNQQHEESDSDGMLKADGRGLHGLLHRAKQKIKNTEPERRDGEALSRARNPGSHVGSPSSSRSLSTKHTGQSESSLLTYGSETESLGPPPLTSRPSHAGYLTLSSPLIQSSQVRDAPDGETRALDSTETKSPLSPAVATVAERAPLDPSSASAEEPGQQGSSSTALKLDGEGNSAEGPIAGRPGSELDTAPAGSPNASGGSGSAPSSRNNAGNEVLGGTRNFPSSVQNPASAAAIAEPVVDLKNSQAPLPQSPARKIVPLAGSPLGSPLTPVTTVTPPTPTDKPFDSPISPTSVLSGPGIKTKLRKTGTESVGPGGGRMLSHRRVKSIPSTTAPRRLSQALPTPLSPTLEETPGLSGTSFGQGGFFSSVFSAAQNAATTLTNSIANTSLNNSGRGRTGTQAAGENLLGQGQTVEATSSNFEAKGENSREVAEEHRERQKPLAVETLGMGDLSLSHLGIDVGSSSDPNTSTSAADGVTQGSGRPSTSGMGAAYVDGTEKSSPARQIDREAAITASTAATAVRDAIKASYGNGQSNSAIHGLHADISPAGNSTVPIVEDPVTAVRSRSTTESNTDGGHGPTNNANDLDGDGGIRRTGSLRSRIDTGLRRKRENSAATGTTVATVAGTNTTIGSPGTPGMAPRLTGFAVASRKRNRDFHQLFRSVPEDDYLIEDYSAAIQKDILLHGRLYISEGHICFNSNIFGYVTNLVISFDEVVSVEKKNTAMVFPNAIVIQTLHARNVFASLASRESTYDLIIGIWKISHPNLRSSLNGVQLNEAGGGDKTVKAEGSVSDTQNEDDEEEAVYDEDADEEDALGSFSEAGGGSVAGSDAADGPAKEGIRKFSSPTAVTGGAIGDAPATGSAVVDKGALGTSEMTVDFPGPTSHSPTDCGDQDKHLEKLVKDEVIPAPLGKVYSLMFGPASGSFMSNWLREEQKVIDLQLEDDKKGLTEARQARTYTYIKPLNAPIGPKQTKCIITETLDSIDLEKAVLVTVVTQTPDVPNGSIFTVKTKYCLMWAEGNSTRLIMSCALEWTGKSWLKSAIEKGASDGQLTYGRDIINALRSEVSTTRSSGNVSKARVRRRKKDVAELSAQASGKPADIHNRQSASQSSGGSSDWGFLEPLHGLMGPFVDSFRPMMTSNVAMGALGVLLMATWLRPYLGSSSSSGQLQRGYPGLSTPERIAAYEEIWRREESDLWDWLDARVGVGRLSSSEMGDPASNGKGHEYPKPRTKVMNSRRIGTKLAEEKMSQQQIGEAIRVTQERLDALKRVVERRDTDSSEHEAGSA